MIKHKKFYVNLKILKWNKNYKFWKKGGCILLYNKNFFPSFQNYNVGASSGGKPKIGLKSSVISDQHSDSI